jgi:hypothetical protein
MTRTSRVMLPRIMGPFAAFSQLGGVGLPGLEPGTHGINVRRAGDLPSAPDFAYEQEGREMRVALVARCCPSYRVDWHG